MFAIRKSGKTRYLSYSKLNCPATIITRKFIKAIIKVLVLGRRIFSSSMNQFFFSLGKLCNILKTISSREIRKEFAMELKPSVYDAPRISDSGKTEGLHWKPVFWKQGYGYTSAGGAAIDVLVKYIENQGYQD